MLLRVTLPALRIVPLKASRPPGVTGLVGQFKVIAMLGTVRIGHVAETVVESRMPVLASLPVAVRVSVAAQVSRATV